MAKNETQNDIKKSEAVSSFVYVLANSDIPGTKSKKSPASLEIHLN
ncbi:hypothetical protein ACFO25_04000 [Paenactinomyces guangxiensis]|uniref:Uncharacterized protein n=1 Tax=Paenactinomyces guangxiensis TaxID=1490290 RepID=A0A7W1WV08_9BACL|nr:hypothetical protein [Paenactinomyces guangxiensis]MBA4496507.1 hypothetical protein [Paenactinomyces guangxiensis]MBH8593642.1 hypothetical protein [Paenactinomyces guangxiensis]